MRKLLWACVGLGVVAAGGLYLAADYACCHPASVVARCVITTLVQPLAGLGPLVAGGSSGGRPGGNAADSAMEEVCIPDDPAPVVEEAPGLGNPPPLTGGDMEVRQEMHLEVRTPAPLVINEEPEPIAPPQTEEPSEAGAKEAAGTPTAATTYGPAIPEKTYPPMMPYCTDDGTPTRMPYADENENAAIGTSWWKRLFHNKAVPESRVPGGEEPSEPDGTSDCREDDQYHQHYPGCPFTGRSCPASPHLKTPEGALPSKRPHDKGEVGEEQEPPAEPEAHGKKQHYKGCQDGDDCPRHPEVDTMEFRPSDRGLNEYGPGGPL